jgi:hypothetical protein
MSKLSRACAPKAGASPDLGRNRGRPVAPQELARGNTTRHRPPGSQSACWSPPRWFRRSRASRLPIVKGSDCVPQTFQANAERVAPHRRAHDHAEALLVGRWSCRSGTETLAPAAEPLCSGDRCRARPRAMSSPAGRVAAASVVLAHTRDPRRIRRCRPVVITTSERITGLEMPLNRDREIQSTSAKSTRHRGNIRAS